MAAIKSSCYLCGKSIMASEMKATWKEAAPQWRERFRQLCRLWGDDEILACTHFAALKALQYKNLQETQKDNYSHVGKSLFFFDKSDPDVLHLLVQMEEQIIHCDVAISDDGALQFSGQRYATPQQLLEKQTEETFLVHPRVVVDSNSPLGMVIAGSFDDNCSISYPPEYPPLLVEVALYNDDCQTAKRVLEHPFIVDRSFPEHYQRRLRHLLLSSVEASIKADKLDFLDFLIERYSLFDGSIVNPDALLQISADHGDISAIAHLLHSFPAHLKPCAYQELLPMAAQKGAIDTFFWLLESTPRGVAIDADRVPKFLMHLFFYCGAAEFHRVAERLKIDIPWESLMEALSATPLNPLSYIEVFEGDGGDISTLPREVQSRLILRSFTAPNPSRTLGTLIAKFRDPTTPLSDALLCAIANDEAVGLLLKYGASADATHFEKLLVTPVTTEHRYRLFNRLLGAITDLDHAESALKLAGAFGEEAFNAVVAKFPELKGNKNFLFSLIAELNSGAKLLGDTMIKELVSGRVQRRSRDIDAPVEGDFAMPLGDGATWMEGAGFTSKDIILDVLLPSRQWDRIEKLLLAKPETIYPFWLHLLFTGIKSVEGDEWEKLAAKSLALLSDGEQTALFSRAFYYAHLPIAALLMRHIASQPPAVIAFSFWEGMATSGCDFIDLLINHLTVSDDLGNSFLHLAAFNNRADVAAVLLRRGVDSSKCNSQGYTPYDIALSNGSITICRIIEGEKIVDTIAEQFLTKSGSDLHQLLVKVLLNSAIRDFFDLTAALKASADRYSEGRESLIAICGQVEQFALGPATLLVRFAQPSFQREVFHTYGKGHSSYEMQQWAWGLQSEQLYRELLESVEREGGSVLQILMKLASARTKDKGYSHWRMGFILKSAGLMTHYHGRYFFFWSIAQKIYRDLLEDPSTFIGELSLTSKGYQVLWRDGDLTLSLTHINIKKPFSKEKFSARMVHSEIKEIRKAIPYFSRLFDELTAEARGAGDGELSLPEKRIAFLFWLGCHITITERGSSQYMVMIHRLIYNLYGWEPAPWSQKYAQPDCIALATPFSLFYRDFYSDLFEGSPRSLLKK